jgi:hypothetical protein
MTTAEREELRKELNEWADSYKGVGPVTIMADELREVVAENACMREMLQDALAVLPEHLPHTFMVHPLRTTIESFLAEHP